MSDVQIALSPSPAVVSLWLRDARKAAEKTRRAASVLLDVTEKTIERWEDPERPASLPDAAQLFALVAFYGADIRTLLDGEPAKRLRGPPLPSGTIVPLATVKKKRSAGGKG